MSSLRVNVVQLQSDDVTRYRLGGYDVDEARIIITDEDRTVESLKLAILQEYFPGAIKSGTTLKVFSCPDTAPQTWVPQVPSAKLEQGKTYGFIDLNEIEPLHRQQQQDGELHCCVVILLSYSMFLVKKKLQSRV